MARLLLIVENVWPLEDFTQRVCHLADRPHLLLVPGIDVEPGERFRPGDRLELIRPDGPTLEGRSRGLVGRVYKPTRNGDWAKYDNAIAVIDLVPEDVPVGTEIWSVDRPSQRPG